MTTTDSTTMTARIDLAVDGAALRAATDDGRATIRAPGLDGEVRVSLSRPVGETGETHTTPEADATPRDADEPALGTPPQATTGEPRSKATFEVFRDRAGEWRWRLRHDNGNVIATSGQGYASRPGARNGLESVRRNAPGARIETVVRSVE